MGILGISAAGEEPRTSFTLSAARASCVLTLQCASAGEDRGVLHNPVLNNCRPRGAEPPAFSVDFLGYLNMRGNVCLWFVMSRFILIHSKRGLYKWSVLLITF